MKPQAESPEHAIRALHQASTSALNQGHLDSLMAVYSDDVISLPPNQPALFGKDAVRSMWQDVLRDFVVEVSVSVDEVEVAGPWAFERGTYDMKLRPRGGGALVEDSGKYLDILCRQSDGCWKYSRVSWSSSQPIT